MAVGYRSSSHTGNDAEASSRAPAVPAGAAVGDVVIVKLSRWGGDPAVTAPSGFTQYPTTFPSGDGAGVVRIFWKRLTASDAGSYTFSWTGSLWSHAHAVCFTGVIETGDPIEDVDGWAGTAGTFGSVSNNTATIPGLLWTTYNDSVGTHTAPTGFTKIIDNDCGASAYRIASATGTQTASGGSVTSSSPASAVLIALKPAAASGSTGTITGTLPSPFAALAGAATAAGALAGTLPTPVAALAGQGVGSGLLAASLPMPSAALVGTARATAVLAGALPELVADIDGAATASGAVDAELPELAGSLTGTVRGLAVLAGELPLPVGAFTGTAETEENLLLGILPELTGALNATAHSAGAVAGTLPMPTAQFIGQATLDAMLTNGLPELEGQFFGVVFDPGEGGQLNGVLPMMVAITGRTSQVRERDQQRRATRNFIMASPMDIILIPNAEVRTLSGAVEMAKGVARPVQTFRLIPMSHTERPVASFGTGEGSAGDVQRKYDLTLLAEWSAVMEKNDYWVDEAGVRYVIEAIIPFNGYERKALVMAYGAVASIV